MIVLIFVANITSLSCKLQSYAKTIGYNNAYIEARTTSKNFQ